jgi:putative tricarboxylic transport membrane protein
MRFKGRNSLQWLLYGFAIAVLVLAPLTSATAEKYPSSPITVIIPWPPGGGADTTVRFLSGALEKDLGVPIVVKNIPGAASMTGMAVLWRAKPDGYTIGMVRLLVASQNWR